MVSFVEEIVSENLNAEENLPAFLLPLVMVDILPVSFICTAWQKQKKWGRGRDGFLLALLTASSQAQGWLCSYSSEPQHQNRSGLSLSYSTGFITASPRLTSHF